jgi:RND family efflux transporter MFP subunit
VIGAALVICVAAGLLRGWGNGRDAGAVEAAKAQKPTVEVAPVTLGNIQRVYRTTGTIAASTEADVAAKVEQRIVTLPFREGDKIKTGAIVAKLDDDEATRQYNIAAKEVAIAEAQLRDLLAGSRPEEIAQAVASYEQAKAAERRAEQTLAHIGELYGPEGGLPSQMIDAARGKLQVAEAQHQASQAAYENALQNYQHVKEQFDLNAEPRLRVQEAEGRTKTAEAQVAAARTALEDAQRDLDRLLQVQAIGGASQESVDKAEARVATAKAQLSSTTAAYDAAQGALDWARQILKLNAAPRQQLDDAQTKFQAAEAQLKAATAAATAAQEDYDHILALYSGPVPRREIDDASGRLEEARAASEAARQKLTLLRAGPTSTQLAVARERMSQAEAKRDAARVLLDYCTVRAPVDGTVIRRMLDLGDIAGPRTPILTIATASHAVVKAALPDKYAALLQLGTPVKVTPSDGSSAIPVVVTRVYGAADSRTRLMPFEVALPEGLNLPIGAMVRLEVVLEEASQVPVVPSDALISRPDGKRVAFIVQDGKAVEVPVETGIEADGQVEIKQGIRENDLLVIAGGEMLKNGMEVKVAKPTQSREKSEQASPQTAQSDSTGKQVGQTPAFEGR